MELRRLRFVERFNVESAQYRLVCEGSSAVLLVDYAGNIFTVESDSEEKDFLEEVAQIARGLLARKHAVNLAQKEHYLL